MPGMPVAMGRARSRGVAFRPGREACGVLATTAGGVDSTTVPGANEGAAAARLVGAPAAAAGGGSGDDSMGGPGASVLGCSTVKLPGPGARNETEKSDRSPVGRIPGTRTTSSCGPDCSAPRLKLMVVPPAASWLLVLACWQSATGR